MSGWEGSMRMSAKKVTTQTNYKHFFGTPEKAAETFVDVLRNSDGLTFCSIYDELLEYMFMNERTRGRYDLSKACVDLDYFQSALVDFLNDNRVVEVEDEVLH